MDNCPSPTSEKKGSHLRGQDKNNEKKNMKVAKKRQGRQLAATQDGDVLKNSKVA